MLVEKPVGLPSYLVPSSELIDALDRLLAGTNHAYFQVQRGWLDFRRGTEQSTTLIVDAADLLDPNGTIDGRLLEARQVNLYASWPDGGFTAVDLTGRKYVVLGTSETMKTAVSRFKEDLKSANTHKRTSTSQITWRLLFPWVLSFAVYFVGVYAPSPVGLAMNFGNDVTDPNLPDWTNSALAVIWVSWLLLAGQAIWIVIQRRLGGGIRIWPQALTRARYAAVAHYVYREARVTSNWSALTLLVIGAVLGGFFNALFS